MAAIEWPWTAQMRPVLQTEAAECGLASLAMVARYHGHRVDLPGLRQRFPTSIKGMTLRQVMAVASELELSPRAVRLEVDELDHLRVPAILHWDLNHFVVLEKVDRRSAWILDPARGRRRISFANIGKHFTGVALELTPTADFRPIEARAQTRLSDLLPSGSLRSLLRTGRSCNARAPQVPAVGLVPHNQVNPAKPRV